MKNDFDNHNSIKKYPKDATNDAIKIFIAATSSPIKISMLVRDS